MSESTEPATLAQNRIPAWVKWSFTGFMAVLVPFYWHSYGPTNFLYFCDVALFLALYAVWKESSLAASAAAVGILIPQLLWQVDFLGSFAGIPVTGMTEYMFDTGIPLFARFLSFFHFWLPILLLYLVGKLGYDRRALKHWTIAAWCLLGVSFLFLPKPGDPLSHPNEPVNVNYVFGPSGDAVQTWMPELAWLSVLLLALPAIFYFPAHMILCRLWGRDHQKGLNNASSLIPQP